MVRDRYLIFGGAKTGQWRAAYSTTIDGSRRAHNLEIAYTLFYPRSLLESEESTAEAPPDLHHHHHHRTKI